MNQFGITGYPDILTDYFESCLCQKSTQDRASPKTVNCQNGMIFQGGENGIPRN